MLTLVQRRPRLHSSSKRQKKTMTRQFPLKPLSSEEVCQVNLASFREGYNHCRWPRDVVEKFLAVQV
jgi:hypothetical protein